MPRLCLCALQMFWGETSQDRGAPRTPVHSNTVRPASSTMCIKCARSVPRVLLSCKGRSVAVHKMRCHTCAVRAELMSDARRSDLLAHSPHAQTPDAIAHGPRHTARCVASSCTSVALISA
eukprot:4376370-Prymnesium_polylepis.1